MFFEISTRCCVLFLFDAYLLLTHIDKFYFFFRGARAHSKID